ncbi:hypothetical protein [Halomonas sp. 3D7M]|uniref:hypothetical protein n=1 Tax=Halomonas sp. 3D7M TaxID=2742617 RepID=UPI000E9A6195|nr:hypothetical protein [Halomonas sp. 3D7M]HBS82014.1 hypothetical protein [Halomonas campaniensis]
MATCIVTSLHYQKTLSSAPFIVNAYPTCSNSSRISLLRISTLNCRAAVFVPADNAKEVRS